MKLNDEQIKSIAKVAYTVNKAFCDGMRITPTAIWEEASNEVKESAISGVKFALKGGTPENSHKEWVRFKASKGYVFDTEKNEEKKTHPCMVPYSELPLIQKAKDHLFLSVVESMNDFFQKGE